MNKSLRSRLPSRTPVLVPYPPPRHRSCMLAPPHLRGLEAWLTTL
jgi:hypothetical protein